MVAIFGDGTKFTMADFRKIFEALPPTNQQMALRNRGQWLHQWELLRKLTKMAEDGEAGPGESLQGSRWLTSG